MDALAVHVEPANTLRNQGRPFHTAARRRNPHAIAVRNAFFRRQLGQDHVALGVAVVSGLLAMERLGWSPAWPRWFGVKLGLVLFLIIPLEAFQAWVALAWLGPGLEETPAPPFSRRLERALSMQDMLWALSALLLGTAVPGLVWMSLARPF